MPGANQIIGSLRMDGAGSAGPGAAQRRLIQKQLNSVTGQVNSLRCGGFKTHTTNAASSTDAQASVNIGTHSVMSTSIALAVQIQARCVGSGWIA